ncbi:MAG: LPS export ABC transporter periplasmic protein LptC [Proteobacteria bacterium]|nr:LPS export ABC transporter periplasmic protein LptC [Pseudomonadota bacterium]MCL2306819.1 LPS export ABC transporter periplasmic protein LptC [Pseudomonadota bacterium]
MTTLRDRVHRWVSWSPLLFLAALAALTYWLDAQVQSPGAGRDALSRHTPDLFIKNFHATQFNAAGLPQQQLTAALAEHFPDDGLIELEQPQIILQNPGQPRFTLTSDRAQFSGDRQDLYLRGSVTAVRDAPSGGSRQEGLSSEPLTLHTEYLHVRPNDNIVRTDQKVSLESPSTRIESVGMEFDRNTHIIKLHANVQGTFQPQRPQRH